MPTSVPRRRRLLAAAVVAAAPVALAAGAVVVAARAATIGMVSARTAADAVFAPAPAPALAMPRAVAEDTGTSGTADGAPAALCEWVCQHN